MKILVNEKISQHKYKTPEGYLICVDSVLARTGNQTYRKNELFVDSEDDSEIEVGRSPEEVFSAETLASFENKPITIEHPDEDVNVENYKDYSVGFVRDVKQGKFDGQDVILGTLVITDKDAIEGIENGEHVELSCGYDCDIEDGADGYQQKHIRGNHVALCEAGRAGIAKIIDSVGDEDTVKYKGYTFKFQKGYNMWLNMKNYYEVFDKQGNKVAMKKDLKSAKEYVDNGSFKDSTEVNDAKKYAVEFTYNGDSVSNYLGQVWVYANSEKEALKKAEQWAKNKYDDAWNFKIVPKAYSNSDVIDSVEDAVLPEAKGQYKGYDVIARHVGYKNAPTEVDIFDGKRKVKSYFTSDEDLTGAIREVYKFWPEPPLTKDDRNFISNYLHMISGFVKRKDTDVQDILRPLYGKGFKPIIEKIEGWIWKKDAYAYKNYYISLDGYSDTFLVTLYADPAQDWDTKEVNAYFTDSAVNDKAKSVFTVSYWLPTKEDDDPWTATAVVYASNEESAKKAVKKAHPKLGGFLEIRKGKLMNEGEILFADSKTPDEEQTTMLEKDLEHFEDADVNDGKEVRYQGYVIQEYHPLHDDPDGDGYIISKNGIIVGGADSIDEAIRKINRKELKRDSIKDVDPRSGESKEDFIARFMRETKNEYPDEKQRLAVAYSYWEKKGRDSMVKDDENYTACVKQLDKDMDQLYKIYHQQKNKTPDEILRSMGYKKVRTGLYNLDKGNNCLVVVFENDFEHIRYYVVDETDRIPSGYTSTKMKLFDSKPKDSKVKDESGISPELLNSFEIMLKQQGIEFTRGSRTADRVNYTALIKKYPRKTTNFVTEWCSYRGLDCEWSSKDSKSCRFHIERVKMSPASGPHAGDIIKLNKTGERVYVTGVTAKKMVTYEDKTGKSGWASAEEYERLLDSKPKDSIYSITIQGQKSKKLVRAKDAREAIDKYNKMFPKDKIKSVKKTDKFNNIIEMIGR